MKRNGILLVVAAMAALLFVGFYQLFSLRFGAGDIFPAYSSYRADPQGAKILFQSLEDLPGLEVNRLLKPLDEEGNGGKTVFMLGGDWQLIRRMDENLRPFIKSGGRAVIAYAPVDPRITSRDVISSDDEEDEESEEAEAVEGDGGECVGTNTCDVCAACIENSWDVRLEQFTRADVEELPDRHVVAFPEVGKNVNPVTWQSAYWFDELGDDWEVLYRYLDKPVVITRKWEEGSVVLLADSYLFSNEAMIAERHTDLIIQLLGSSSKILFDELHLGVESTEGVMTLVNRYRLQGVLLAVFVLAGLYIWQRTTSFIPRHSDDLDGTGDVGADVGSMTGFINLLTRHLPQKKLMQVIMEEGRASFKSSPTAQKKMDRVDAEFRKLLAANPKAHPVELYNRLTGIWNERK